MFALATVGAATFLTAGLNGCGASHPATPVPLAASLQDILPHGDRDHFVFVWERLLDGKRLAAGVQVEHVTALETPGEFEVSLSENGRGTGRLRFRDDSRVLRLLSEDDFTRGIRFTYDPPLPYIEEPLIAGERRYSADVRVTSVEDSVVLDTLHITQVTQLEAVTSIRSLVGPYPNGVSLQITRYLETPEGTIELRSARLLVSGVGEIRTKGSRPTGPTVRRELACAVIGGRGVGDCHRVGAVAERLRDGEPVDAQ